MHRIFVPCCLVLAASTTNSTQDYMALSAGYWMPESRLPLFSTGNRQPILWFRPGAGRRSRSLPRRTP